MKKLFLSLLLLFFILIFAPYVIYFKIINDGIEGEYLTIKTSTINLAVNNKMFHSMMLPAKIEYVESLWKFFHFSQYVIELPVKHPEFILVPIVEKIPGENGINLGLKFLNHNKKNLFSFKTNGQNVFETYLEKHKLFLLPIFKNYIISKGPETIWNDLFTKNLILVFGTDDNDKKNTSLLAKINNLWKTSYKELVYDLFIYNLRTVVFPKDIKKILYLSEKKMAVIETIRKDSGSDEFRSEEIFLFVDDSILKMIIETNFASANAIDVRDIFLAHTSYKKEEENSFDLVYDGFKNLQYELRKDQVGMTYLLAAWSHKIEEKKILQEIIYYLEKGRDNFMQLDPFYQYAYNVYGNTLSSLENPLDTSEVTLKKKILEELNSETSKEKRKELLNYDGNFETSEEKVEFYLKKAKSKQETENNPADANNSEGNENILYEN